MDDFERKSADCTVFLSYTYEYPSASVLFLHFECFDVVALQEPSLVLQDSPSSSMVLQVQLRLSLRCGCFLALEVVFITVTGLDCFIY